MISVNPSNVLNLLWRHFDEYTVTNVVTEREKSLSTIILTLIESAMVSSSPLPGILKYVAAHHSSTSPNTFSPGLSSSPSSSSSYLDSNNFGYNNSNRHKDTTISSSSSMSFRSVTRTESIQSSVKPPTSSGAIIGNKTRPAKPARKSHVSPIQCSSSSNQLSCNNNVSVKSIGSSIQRRQISDVTSSTHGLLTRGDSDLVRGVTTVPVPIPPSNSSSSSRSTFRGMFSMNNKKSRSMAVLPTSEDKCGPLNLNCNNNSTVASGGIFTRTNTSSFRAAPKTGRFASSNNGFGRNYNSRDVTSSSVNGNKEKNGCKDITRCTSQQQKQQSSHQQQQQQQVSSSSVSSFAINGKNQPFSYSQPNNTVSSVTNKLNASCTGKVSSTGLSNGASSTAVSSVNNTSDVNCTSVTMLTSSCHSATSSTNSCINNNSTIRGSAGTPDTNPIESMAKSKKVRHFLINFLLRRPTIDSLREKGIFKDEPVFGCHLANLCAREKTTVPKFVRNIISAIESKDLRSDGIYRVCGNLSQVQKIRFQVNQDNYSGIWKEDDVHVLTGLLKMFFRDMKDPIFPCSHFDSLMSAISITERKGRLDAIRKVVDSLPNCNYDTLKYLLQHLLRVKEMSDDNRMHIQNLAIVFGPTLMWHETEKVSKVTPSNHSSVTSNNNGNTYNSNSPTSSSCITGSSTVSSMAPFTYGNLMNGINGSFANDMLQKIKSNQLVEFLLNEFESLFTRN